MGFPTFSLFLSYNFTPQSTICDGDSSPAEDIGYNEDIPADASPTPTLENPQLAHGCPAPVYMARTCQDATESKESYVISLHDGAGCLAHSIKDKLSSLGYTKCIALERDYSQKVMAARANPAMTQTNGSMVFPGIQHGIGGMIHSPSDVTLEHITNMSKNSIRLFVSNIAGRQDSQAKDRCTKWDNIYHENMGLGQAPPQRLPVFDTH